MPQTLVNDPVMSFVKSYPSLKSKFSGTFYLKTCKLTLPCKDWKRGYLAAPKEGKNKLLKQFFRQKVEETAKAPEDFIFLCLISKDSKEKWLFLLEIKPFLEQTPLSEIERICREDPFIRNENAIEFTLSMLKSFREEHCDCQN